MRFDLSISELVHQRYSCRNYLKKSIDQTKQAALSTEIGRITPGPFGSSARFGLAASNDETRSDLSGLGTYGFVRGVPAFLIGAVVDRGKALEDFGYQMELLILAATDLGLNTCWLGGSFTRSSFARKISAAPDEIIPAVTALGYADPGHRGVDETIRRGIGGQGRLTLGQPVFRWQIWGSPVSRSRRTVCGRIGACAPRAIGIQQTALAGCQRG